MKNNDLVKMREDIYRVLDVQDGQALVIRIAKKSMPKWVNRDDLFPYAKDVLVPLIDINDMDALSRKCAHERFTMIAGILPFVADKRKRCAVINQVVKERGISRQTIQKYLWLYLAYQNIAVLAPKPKTNQRELTADEKNIRWALNRYYYTRYKHSLNTAYTLMIKEKYCNASGKLLDRYPSFYQFRYFYRQHRTEKKYFVSREGIKSYQRNHRPLLGEGVQDFAHCVGYGMLDATVCDIYLVNKEGKLIGRPILTTCIDGYSGMCCGYSLSWEGGVYSLRNLMLHVIADKKEWCKRFGIDIDTADWNCNQLPSTIVTDMGREYVSNTFEQIADLGITLINLPPYRPELKGPVEKFFDVIQGLYKPHLKGKGVIEPDFQERGVRDYRKDACLTMTEFEEIIVRCILHYNTRRIIEDFPYTGDMIGKGIKPFANSIWNYAVEQPGANLISVDGSTLVFTLLPRIAGRFTRKGLIVNGLRYRNEAYTEQYLKGGEVMVAYNPENVSEVWLIEKGNYVKFSLIESRFLDKDMAEVLDIRERQKTLENAERKVVLQAKIDLARHISLIAQQFPAQSGVDIRDIRQNRRREQQRTHMDFIRESAVND